MLERYTERVVAHAQLSDYDPYHWGDVSFGKAWFAMAADECRLLAKHCRVSPMCAAAVVAALSPSKRWPDQNLQLAREVMSTLNAGFRPGGHTQAQLGKAAACMGQAFAQQAASFLPHLKGPKVRAFFLSIANELGPTRTCPPVTAESDARTHELAARCVTLDRWAVRVCDPSPLAHKNLKPQEYDDMRAAYVEATILLNGEGWNLNPTQTQAICWVAVRGRQ